MNKTQFISNTLVGMSIPTLLYTSNVAKENFGDFPSSIASGLGFIAGALISNTAGVAFHLSLPEIERKDNIEGLKNQFGSTKDALLCTSVIAGATLGAEYLTGNKIAGFAGGVAGSALMSAIYNHDNTGKHAEKIKLSRAENPVDISR